MKQNLRAIEVEIAYHPKGFRIDKTTSPMNRYTRWDITAEGKWANPKPVCFDSLPAEGWIEVNQFDWNKKLLTRSEL